MQSRPCSTLPALLAVLLVLVLPGLVGPAGAQQQAYFGINAYGHGSLFFDSAEPEDGFAAPSQAQADAGVEWSRVGLNWFNIQPDGNGDDPEFEFDYNDTIVSSLTSRGIEVVGVLGGVPKWASEEPDDPFYFQYPPDDIDQWANYVQTTVDHYEGTIGYWEVWNEPNFDLGWRPAADVNEYFSLLQRSSQVIRAANPDAKVVLGGLSGIDVTFLNQLVALGAWPLIDVVSIHPYDMITPPEKSGRVENLMRLRAYVASLGAKPIWYTEASWPSEPFTEPHALSLAEHADYLVRDYVQSLGLGAERYAWWNLQSGDDPDLQFDNTGIVHEDLSPKPAYTAYAAMAGQLAGATFNQRRQPYAQTLITGFETDEAWAASGFDGGSSTFTRTTAEQFSGGFSGKWDYVFTAPLGDGDLALLARDVLLPGVPTRFSVWVKPDNGDHRLSLEFEDDNGEVWRVKLGFTIGTGWQRMTGDLADATNPFGGDGTIDYPIRIDRFFLESYLHPESPFFGNKADGTIYLDDFSWDAGKAHVRDLQFHRGGGFVDVIWATDGLTRPIPFPVGEVTVTDDQGSSTDVTDGGGGDLDGLENGVVTIGATSSPVFVSWARPNLRFFIASNVPAPRPPGLLLDVAHADGPGSPHGPDPQSSSR